MRWTIQTLHQGGNGNEDPTEVRPARYQSVHHHTLPTGSHQPHRTPALNARTAIPVIARIQSFAFAGIE